MMVRRSYSAEDHGCCASFRIRLLAFGIFLVHSDLGELVRAILQRYLCSAGKLQNQIVRKQPGNSNNSRMCLSCSRTTRCLTFSINLVNRRGNNTVSNLTHIIVNPRLIFYTNFHPRNMYPGLWSS